MKLIRLKKTKDETIVNGVRDNTLWNLAVGTTLSEILDFSKKFRMQMPEGTFYTVYGYWYYIVLKPTKECEINWLKYKTGKDLIRIGDSLMAKRGKDFYKTPPSDEDKRKISCGIWYKFRRVADRFIQRDSKDMKIVYLVDNGDDNYKVPRPEFQWFVDDINKMKEYLYDKIYWK